MTNTEDGRIQIQNIKMRINSTSKCEKYRGWKNTNAKHQTVTNTEDERIQMQKQIQSINI